MFSRLIFKGKSYTRILKLKREQNKTFLKVFQVVLLYIGMIKRVYVFVDVCEENQEN